MFCQTSFSSMNFVWIDPRLQTLWGFPSSLLYYHTLSLECVLLWILMAIFALLRSLLFYLQDHTGSSLFEAGYIQALNQCCWETAVLCLLEQYWDASGKCPVVSQQSPQSSCWNLQWCQSEPPSQPRFKPGFRWSVPDRDRAGHNHTWTLRETGPTSEFY